MISVNCSWPPFSKPLSRAMVGNLSPNHISQEPCHFRARNWDNRPLAGPCLQFLRVDGTGNVGRMLVVFRQVVGGGARTEKGWWAGCGEMGEAAQANPQLRPATLRLATQEQIDQTGKTRPPNLLPRIPSRARDCNEKVVRIAWRQCNTKDTVRRFHAQAQRESTRKTKISIIK